MHLSVQEHNNKYGAIYRQRDEAFEVSRFGMLASLSTDLLVSLVEGILECKYLLFDLLFDLLTYDRIQ